jgi:hypothetical protein
MDLYCNTHFVDSIATTYIELPSGDTDTLKMEAEFHEGRGTWVGKTVWYNGSKVWDWDQDFEKNQGRRFDIVVGSSN